MEPYTLLGERQIAEISSFLRVRFIDWISLWSFGEKAGTVKFICRNILSADVCNYVSGWTVYKTEEKLPFLAVKNEHMDLSAFLFMIGGDTISERDLQKLSKMAMSDLHANMATESSIQECELISSMVKTPWSACSFEFKSGTFTFCAPNWYWLKIANIKAINSKKSQQILFKRGQAVSKCKSRLNIRHDFGAISLETLQNLTAGEVLLAETKVNTPFVAKVGEHISLDCSLGRIDGNKAIVLRGINEK